MGRESELLAAAQSGNVSQIEKLLQNKKGTLASFRKGVNPNCQDESGSTPLHLATLNGKKEAVQLLLDYSASNCIPDSSGSYPLHLAAWNGDTEISRLLINRGPSRAKVNEQNERGDTALHSASQYGHDSVVSFLLQAGADPSVRNLSDESPLDLAAQYDRRECARLLLSHDRELATKNGRKHSPLHLAARNGHSDMILLLLEFKMNVNVVTEKGTSLHEAALFEKLDVVKELLEAGIDINVRDSMGNTALNLVSDHRSERAQKIIDLLKQSQEAEYEKRISQITMTATANSSDTYSDYALLGEEVPTASKTAATLLQLEERSHSLPGTNVAKSKNIPPDLDTKSVPRSQTADFTVPFSPPPSTPNDATTPPTQTPPLPQENAENSNPNLEEDESSALPKKIGPPKPERTFKEASVPLSEEENKEGSEEKEEGSEEEEEGSEEEEEGSEEELDVCGDLEWVVSPTNPFAGLQITGSMDEKCVAVVNERISRLIETGEKLEIDEGRESDWDQIDKLLEAVETLAADGVEDDTDMGLEKSRELSLSKSLEELIELGSPSSSPESMQEWIGETVGLPQYADLLIANGFDDLRFLANGILQENDLLTIGVENENDRRLIMAGLEFLPPQCKIPLSSAASSLGYWLESLNLTQYTATFVGRGFTSMSLVANLAGISNIETVLPIYPLGHQRRIKVSIDLLFGPKALPPSVISPSNSIDRSVDQLLNEAEQESKSETLNLARDYTRIKSTLTEKQDDLHELEVSPPPDEINEKEKSPERGALRAAGTRRKSSDVPMLRPPQQAQLENRQLKGLPTETRFTETDIWRHPPRVLMKGNVNYVSKYLGSMLVEKVMGKQSTVEACRKMRASTRKMKKVPLIVLAISARGIKFIDAESKNVIQEHKIHSISYCSQDREDLKTFAYINKDSLIGKHYCHVFCAQNPEMADEIILTLGQAFEIAYQKALQHKARKEAAKFEEDLQKRRAEKSEALANANAEPE